LLILIQIGLGALWWRAWTPAWPTTPGRLMDGAIVPSDLFIQKALVATCSIMPRPFSLTTASAPMCCWPPHPGILSPPRERTGSPHAARAGLLLLMIVFQAALGITTLVLVVPFGWALAHHGFAIVTLGFAVAHWRATVGPYPVETKVIDAKG
jgi:cytochrome c oxidase assembly protein subunit 15